MGWQACNKGEAAYYVKKKEGEVEELLKPLLAGKTWCEFSTSTSRDPAVLIEGRLVGEVLVRY